MQDMEIAVSLPTDDDGFVGRACVEPTCGQYFKIYVPDVGDELWCPYCGTRSAVNELFTAEQLEHAMEVVAEEAQSIAAQMIGKSIDAIFRGVPGCEVRPGNYRGFGGHSLISNRPRQKRGAER